MKKLIVLSFSLLISLPSFTQESSSNREKHFNLEKNIAIEGYDPVSYFKEGKAKKGSSSLAYTYKSATYYFSSEANRKLFKAEPSTYEPQYGGWCAYAIGESGEKVEINPKTFKITDGKLYLFYNAYFTNTLPLWEAKEKELKEKADSNWKGIIAQ